MNKIVWIFTLLLTVSSVPDVHADDADISNLFTKRNINGSMIISSLDGKIIYTHNDERANTRLAPASTFKILNTLIALEENAVTSGKELIKWDGQDKGLEAWNKDQSIETAFPSSCVWFYQELAKRLGKETYERYLRGIGYGNAGINEDLTTFWLNGDLKISAAEQINFLKKIYKKEYPFRSSSYDTLAGIMIVDQSPTYTVRAKTGWAQRVTPQVGWYVGYVETVNNVWFFATNLDISKPEDGRLRQVITYEALKEKGII